MKTTLTIYFHIILLIVSLNGCSKNDQFNNWLEEIEHMPSDSALTEINAISSNTIMDEEQKAYYNISKTKIYFRNAKEINDSCINQSINYFNATNNSDKLAECYYIKGMLYYETDKNTAIQNLKKAELLANNIKNLQLKHKIVWAIGSVNLSVGDLDIALEYFKKRCEIAKIISEEYFANSLISLAVCYHEKGVDDSSMAICNIIERQINNIDKQEMSFYYNLLGELYENIDIKKSITYFEESTKHGYLPQSYASLSKLYIKTGNWSKTDSLIKKVMDSSCYEIQIDLLQSISSTEEQNANYAKALEYSNTIISLKDSLHNRINKCKVIKEQQDFKCRIDEIEQKRKATLYTFIVILLILLIIFLFLLIRYRKLSIEKKHTENELETRRLREQLYELKASGEASLLQIEELSEKLREKETEWKSQASNGEILMDQIIQNQGIIKWDNNDIHDFVEYYQKSHNDFTQYINSTYNQLSDNELMLLILENMQKTDSLIQEILCISPAAVRMRRSRINKKKKV